jgi:hypothetical protein
MSGTNNSEMPPINGSDLVDRQSLGDDDYAGIDGTEW